MDSLEKDIAGYEASSQNKFPEAWGVPLLLQLLPDSHRGELELKFSLGERDYGKLMESIVGYSNGARVIKQRAKHPNDMDVDHLEDENGHDYTTEDWKNYCEALEYQNYELNYMGTKGSKGKKGKDGGKGGWQHKGSKGYKGAGKGGQWQGE